MKGIDRGRFKRALSLYKLGAKLAVKQGKSLLSSDKQSVQREVARALTQELGKLKGLPMKIGQLLSYMDGLVPDEYADIYTEALGALRIKTQPLDHRECMAVLETSLGAEATSLFERFDPEPIAAASIGQVYRARYKGQEVCVKVQYPGIAEATEDDLKNIGAIVTLIRTLMPKINTEQMIEDFKLRLREECDYRKEADNQQRFAKIYKDDPDLYIPEVIEAVSSDKVITTRFIQGVNLEEFLEDATEEERNRAGLALFRFAFATLLDHGLFHADPHPGNLLFRTGPSAKLTVLDFGCVQPIDRAARNDIRALLDAAMRGAPLAEKAEVALGIEAIDEQSRVLIVQLVEHILSPILAPQPFRFTRDFSKDIARAVIDAKAKMAKSLLTRKVELVFKREGVMFVVRNLFGLASIWGALKAHGDFRALTETMVKAMPADASPS